MAAASSPTESTVGDKHLSQASIFTIFNTYVPCKEKAIGWGNFKYPLSGLHPGFWTPCMYAFAKLRAPEILGLDHFWRNFSF